MKGSLVKVLSFFKANLPLAIAGAVMAFAMSFGITAYNTTSNVVKATSSKVSSAYTSFKARHDVEPLAEVPEETVIA